MVDKSKYVYILLIVTNDQTRNEKERIAAMPATCVNSNLRKATRMVSGYYDGILAEIGLHGNQMMMLVPPYLAGSISMNKMAEKLDLDRTTLLRNLKLIEKQGLITIQPGKDLRTRMVSLTPKGSAALLAALPLWEKAQRDVISFLGAQHDDLTRALSKLHRLELG